MKHLARLLRSGVITPQTYAEGLSALAEIPPTPAPRQRREPPTPAPRQRREQPTPAPRQWRESPTPAPCQRPTLAPREVPSPDTAGMDAYIEEILSQMPDERPIPALCRRRPIPVPRQLVIRRTRWVIGSFLRGWQIDVTQGHPHGADPRAFLEGVRPHSGQARGRDQGSEWN